MLAETDLALAHKFITPLARILLGMAAGLLLANILEALRWTNGLARMARPLAAAARLNAVAASAFAMSFVSPAAANGMLSGAYEEGRIGMRELMLANLFNALPAWLAHMPTMFLLTWPVLGPAALTYTGITLLAALARTMFTIFLGRLLLPLPGQFYESQPQIAREPFGCRLAGALAKAWRRFCKRLPKLALFTVPMYALMFACQECGFFQMMEVWLGERLQWLAFLKPQAMGIIVMQLAAEMGATLGAAGAALADGSLSPRDVVLAMLIGNVLATPLRAVRHQLPAYAGFYRPAVALKLVLANQALRAASMILAIAFYMLWWESPPH